jgi:hypothetical protein
VRSSRSGSRFRRSCCWRAHLPSCSRFRLSGSVDRGHNSVDSDQSSESRWMGARRGRGGQEAQGERGRRADVPWLGRGHQTTPHVLLQAPLFLRGVPDLAHRIPPRHWASKGTKDCANQVIEAGIPTSLIDGDDGRPKRLRKGDPSLEYSVSARPPSARRRANEWLQDGSSRPGRASLASRPLPQPGGFHEPSAGDSRSPAPGGRFRRVVDRRTASVE